MIAAFPTNTYEPFSSTNTNELFSPTNTYDRLSRPNTNDRLSKPTPMSLFSQPTPMSFSPQQIPMIGFLVPTYDRLSQPTDHVRSAFTFNTYETLRGWISHPAIKSSPPSPMITEADTVGVRPLQGRHHATYTCINNSAHESP